MLSNAACGNIFTQKKTCLDHPAK